MRPTKSCAVRRFSAEPNLHFMDRVRPNRVVNDLRVIATTNKTREQGLARRRNAAVTIIECVNTQNGAVYRGTGAVAYNKTFNWTLFF